MCTNLRIVAAVALFGCARETKPPASPAPPRSGPSIVHLDPSSRVPLIERDARLVASYVDALDRKPSVAFMALSHTDQLAWLDDAVNDTPASRLDKRVDDYLARGHWVAMQAARRVTVGDFSAWTLGSGLNLTIEQNRVTFRDDEGRYAGTAQYGVHDQIFGCDRAALQIRAAAYDPLTHLVWLAYVDADGTSNTCSLHSYYETFYYYDPCSYDPTRMECSDRRNR